MARVECAAGDNIITQGEHGEHFYLVETGEFDIFVDFKDGERKLLVVVVVVVVMVVAFFVVVVIP